MPVTAIGSSKFRNIFRVLFWVRDAAESTKLRVYMYIYIAILCCCNSRILHVSHLITKTGTVTNTKPALVFLRKVRLRVINSVCSVCYKGITYCTNVLFFCLSLIAVLEAAFVTACCLSCWPMQLVAAGWSRMGRPSERTFLEISVVGLWRRGVWQMVTDVSDETADSMSRGAYNCDY